MTDTSKQPSKGAMRAARVVVASLESAASKLQILTNPDARGRLVETLANTLERETRAGEMADLLRQMCEVLKDDARPMTNRQHDVLVRAERLLKEIES